MAVQILNDLEFMLNPRTFCSFSVFLHIAFLLVLSLVWLCGRCNEERSKEKAENNNFLYHKLTFCTALGLGLFYFLFSVFSVFSSNSDVLIKLDMGVRTIFWFLFCCYMQFEFGRLREKQFPVLFRALFGLYLLISIYSLVLHLVSLQTHAIVGPQFWVFDFASVLMALLLNYAGFFGKQTEREPDPFLQEPLLNETSKSSVSKDSLYTNAGFFSHLTFSWVSPFLSLGYRKTINLEDMPELDEKNSINSVLPVFKTKLELQMGANGRVTTLRLAKALIFTCFWEIIITGFYEIVCDLSSYVGPYLIVSFVQYLYGTERSNKQGYLLVLAFTIAEFFECLSGRHYVFQLQQVGLRLQAALVGTIYQKGLTLSSQSRQSRTIGEMINIMSVDANRISNFTWYMHDFWLVPLQIGLALTILYLSLGIASVFALVATILVMLVNIPFSRMQENFQEKMMESKDVRMKTMSEVLRNMRVLKLQGWEMKFLSKICSLRKTEVNWLKKLVYAEAGLTVFFWATPTFVAVVTFGACMIMGIPLSTGKVLSALATIRMLQGPIYCLPDTISTLIQTKVSLDRISSFLCLEDLPTDVVYKAPKESSEVAIEVQNGTFSWDPESETPTIKDLNFRALHGMRVAVCGIVGSGKSSLLSCILGEMPKVSGVVQLCGSTAYVSQLPWIQSGKIEDNILFGTEMNRDRYDKVLEVCSLNKDLEILPHGDQTIIGERGINLSGGQKQRIQIARALYQDADIFLFDDPFSALDAHTGSHLFKVYLEIVFAFLGFSVFFLSLLRICIFTLLFP
jgi:ABC-type bacteriocin/lantibiotic exporter with double-glycine peptidase domain